MASEGAIEQKGNSFQRMLCVAVLEHSPAITWSVGVYSVVFISN